MKSDKLCECGCGEFTNIATRKDYRTGTPKGAANRFLEHHAARAALDGRRGIKGHRELHGMSYKPIYRTWIGMVQRCTYAKHDAWDNYGGRGIKVCERWMVFSNFLADMGDRPAGTTLDRIDVNGNYEPGNCRWLSRFEQHGNYRNNIKLTFNGKTLHIAAWERETGLGKKTIRDRLQRGWSVEETLTTAPTLPGRITKRRTRDEVTGRMVSRAVSRSEPPAWD